MTNKISAIKLLSNPLSPNQSLSTSISHQHQKGFTLVELMIVVAIIGVLSSIAVPVYKNYVKKSELAAAVATLKNLVTPAELYYQEKGNITTSTDIGASLGISSDSSTLGTISISKTNELQMKLKNRDIVLTLARSDTGWKCTSEGVDQDEEVKGCN